MNQRALRIILWAIVGIGIGLPIILYVALRITVACLVIDNSGSHSGSPALMDIEHPEPAATNTIMRLFVKPFPGSYSVLNYFDHDLPIAPNDTNGYQLTWQGAKAQPRIDIGGYDGHMGVDWRLAEGTPLFAVTNARVFFAGKVDGPCFLENNRIVSGWQVNLEFVAPDGQTYTANYYHLSRTDVNQGDQVTAGQQIGLSGATGCTGGGPNNPVAHLHLQIERIPNPIAHAGIPIDPYGWEGPGTDPWAACIPNGKSVWLWKEGQAPSMSREGVRRDMRKWLNKWF
jgi:murein DD-endopeptidase MepM/ murein hydrolase activator NlpD